MAQMLLNGIVLGTIYALIALGLTLIFSIMRVVNFAHGQMYMLGGFVVNYGTYALLVWQWPLVREVWGTAAELKVPSFSTGFSKFEIQDDHIALNRAGIPAIDIIDFDYVHWHRLTDVPENCSGDSLEQVAKVLSVWMQRVK